MAVTKLLLTFVTVKTMRGNSLIRVRRISSPELIYFDGLFLCPYYSLAVKKIWRMPSSEFTLVAKSHCFDEREEHPLFSYPYPAVLGNVKTMRNMQQVIEFESSAKEQQPIDVRATIQRKLKSINLWLDAKSEFYSRICEFSVIRRLVIRVNLVSLCVIVAAVAIEQQPITSVVSTLCAGWIVYRINKTDKRGGAE